VDGITDYNSFDMSHYKSRILNFLGEILINDFLNEKLVKVKSRADYAALVTIGFALRVDWRTTSNNEAINLLD
jgi:hypothetical protein